MKKREPEGMELMKSDKTNFLSLLPPQYLSNIVPPVIPSVTYEMGLIGGWFHKKKVGQIAEVKRLEAEMAESTYREVKAKLGTVQEVLTFSAKTELVFKEVKHREKMMEYEEKESESRIVNIQLDNQLKLGQVDEQKLKNQMLEGEVKLNAVELELKMLQLEEIKNGTSQT